MSRAQSGPSSADGLFGRSRLRLLAWSAATLALVGAAGLGMLALSAHVVSGNSDGATVALEGQALASGNVLLHGWTLSLDSFWTVDALFYAVAAGLTGISSALLTAVPAVIVLLVTVTAAALAVERQRGLAALAAGLAVAAVLALPSRTLGQFFLQGPLHDATTLWCLLAFTALSANRTGVRWFLGVLLLASGVLGDFQMLVLGFVPIAVVGVLAGLARREARSELPTIGAPIVAGGLAFIVRRATESLGAFSMAPQNPFASGHQILRNIAHLPGFWLDLLGVERGPFGSTALPVGIAVLHLIAALFVLLGPIVTAWSLASSLRRRGTVLSAEQRLDGFLAVGFAGDLILFVVLPITNSDSYARYLVPGVVFGAVLGARLLARTLARRRRVAPLVLSALAGVAAVYGLGFGLELAGTRVSRPQVALARFLESRHLTNGVGDYWSATITTVVSRGSVEVRPVIADHGRIVRYEKQSTASWYGSRRFQFVVYRPKAVWNGVTAHAARKTFGRAAHSYRVGPYRVLVWKHPFVVSKHGWAGP